VPAKYRSPRQFVTFHGTILYVWQAESSRNKGQGEVTHRKYRRLKLGGGLACDLSMSLSCLYSVGYKGKAQSALQSLD